MSRRVTETTSTVQGFFEFISERHEIWVRRRAGQAPPWTKDEILNTFKFTNVFRQLDRGTIALAKMVQGQKDPVEIMFNIWWYRLFNYDVHAERLGFTKRCEFDKMIAYFRSAEGKVFTSAHMTTGIAGESKVETYLRACTDARDYCLRIAEVAFDSQSMEDSFKMLLNYWMIGKFVAYEIVCDMRFLLPDFDPHDHLTWANVGPGAKRGMQRLGMDPTVKSMIFLWRQASEELTGSIRFHHPLRAVFSDTWRRLRDVLPFELREIEHCLCEFDKYERVRTGQGRPRERYRHENSTSLPLLDSYKLCLDSDGPRHAKSGKPSRKVRG